VLETDGLTRRFGDLIAVDALTLWVEAGEVFAMLGGNGSEQPTGETEAVVVPFELQDFTLYYTLRFGYPPPKVVFLAYCAWCERYSIGEIRRCLGVSSTASSGGASSSRVPSRTRPRWAPAARSRPAGTIARRATVRQRPGCARWS
jgi:hypothetical protein